MRVLEKEEAKQPWWSKDLRKGKINIHLYVVVMLNGSIFPRCSLKLLYKQQKKKSKHFWGLNSFTSYSYHTRMIQGANCCRCHVIHGYVSDSSVLRTAADIQLFFPGIDTSACYLLGWSKMLWRFAGDLWATNARGFSVLKNSLILCFLNPTLSQGLLSHPKSYRQFESSAFCLTFGSPMRDHLRFPQ